MQPWHRHRWARAIWALITEHNRKARGKQRVPINASAYSFRHSRISELLQLHGIDPLTVAHQTGTSLAMIEKSLLPVHPVGHEGQVGGGQISEVKPDPGPAGTRGAGQPKWHAQFMRVALGTQRRNRRDPRVPPLRRQPGGVGARSPEPSPDRTQTGTVCMRPCRSHCRLVLTARHCGLRGLESHSRMCSIAEGLRR